MMNISKFINEHIYRILIASIILGGVVYAAVLFPMTVQTRELKRQEGLLANNIQVLNDVMTKGFRTRSLPRLIASNETSKVIDEITALSAKRSITLLSLVQLDRKKSTHGKISNLPIQLETSSTFNQLGIFMAELNDLQHGIVLIDSFQIVDDEKVLGNIKSKILLQICLKKEGNGKK